MKKYYYILITLLIIASSSVFAQSNDNSQTSSNKCNLGFEATVSYVDYIGSANNTIISTNLGVLGGSAGTYLNLLLNDKFSFQPELLFCLKGGKAITYTSDYPYQLNSSSITTQTDHLYYVELPLQVKYTMKKGFFIIAGPSIGLWLGGTYNRVGTVTNSGVTTNPVPINGNYKVSEELS